MSDHIQISDVSPRVRYVADGVTSVFTYPFAIFEDTDLEVYVDGAIMTLTTDYTVTGAGISAGGSVTLTSPAASSEIVTLVRRLAIARTTDFQASGEFRAKVINDELDFQTAALQQIEDDLARTVQLDRADASADLVIPDAADRAGRALTFDENGNVSVTAFVDLDQDTVVSTAIPAAGSLSGSAGVSIELSAADHAHPLPSLADLGIASQAEAEAGTENTKAITSLRAAQAIAALVDGSDQIARDMAASALAYVMAVNDASSITGNVGTFWLSDDFESDNLAVSTNATYDASGDYYTTSPGGYTSNVIPAMTADDAPSGTASGDGSTYSAAYKAFDGASGGWASSTSWPTKPWLEYEFDTARTITRFQTKNMPSGYEQNWIDYRLLGWNGSAWDTLHTVTGANGSTNTIQAYDVSNPGSYARYRFEVDANTSSWSYVGMAEIEMYENVAPANVILSPTAATLTTADPLDLVAYVVVQPVSTITYGTDIIMTMSIDGGTTDATGSWTKIGDIGNAGEELYRVEADVSAQAGSSLTYEITTANNKEIRYHDCVGLIAIY